MHGEEVGNPELGPQPSPFSPAHKLSRTKASPEKDAPSGPPPQASPLFSLSCKTSLPSLPAVWLPSTVALYRPSLQLSNCFAILALVYPLAGQAGMQTRHVCPYKPMRLYPVIHVLVALSPATCNGKQPL